MSSDFPPQLQLRLPPSTTSFKRSFEEFGFDLPSPRGDSESNGTSSSHGNERNKRPRSASSTISVTNGSPGTASQSSSHSRISTTASSSGSASFAHATTTRLPPLSALSATRPTTSAASGSSLVGDVGQSTRSFHDITALPTPDTIQDIEMLNFLSTDSAPPPYLHPSQTSNPHSQQFTPSAQTTISSSSTASSPTLPASIIASPVISVQPPPPRLASSPPVPQTGEHLRLSFSRFSSFDAEIATLRRSQSLSPLAPRSITPPPTLPPLTLSDDQPNLSEAALPYLHPDHRMHATLPQSLDARARRAEASMRDDAISRSADVVPFEDDLRIDPRLQPAAQRRGASPLLSAQNSPIQPFHEDTAWPQHTQTITTTTADPSMAVTAMRHRLDSALEPLRSASPLVPELAEPRPPIRQSRTTAPTLPPLRTQLQNTTPWDDLSPYRMLFYGPSGSIANGVVQENLMQEDRPAHENTNLNNSRVPPPTFWEGGLYPYAASNPSFTNNNNNNNNRDRGSVSQDPRGPPTAAAQPPVESDIPFPSAAQPLASLPHPAIIFDDLEIGAHPSSLEEPPQPSSARNHPQQLSSSSSESLARSSLEGYLSSEEWLPALRRRSAWRLLDSDEEERLPIDARRFRMLAERREAATAAARAGRQDMGSLLESTEPRPWIDIEADRRSTAAANRQPDPMLRSNPTPAERHSGPERTRFWDDAGDRVPGGVMEYDNYDNWLRSEPRTDLSQRLERLADLDYDTARPSLTRSNTSTSTLGPLNRFRNRLYHSSSTRFGSSNSLVAENSSEFRRRSARQEWPDRFSRMVEGRTPSQADSRPPRSTLPDMTVDETRRPGLGTPRLYGSIDGLDEPRQSDPFSFEGDHIFEQSYPSPRRVTSLPRPPTLPSSWADHASRRPASPPHPQLGRSNTTSIHPIRDRDEPERFSRFLDYIHDYRESSLYVPSPFDFAVPSMSPPRVPDEPLPGHRIRSESHTESWFSRRRHLSSRSSAQSHAAHAETWIDLAAEYAAERSPTESARTAGAGFGPRVGSTRQADRQPSFAELRASYERNTTHADETSRHSPTSPVGSYLIDVPSLPSPDLSELLENVPHFPQTVVHEERFVTTRPLADIPPRLFPRRRSPSPVPPPLPPVSAVPSRLQARARAAERQPISSGRATSFEHIDPELFAPGPYRNTIQSMMRRREASPPPPPSRPPIIPPFAFESGAEREGIPPSRRYRHIYADAFDSREAHHHPPIPRAESNEEPPPLGSFWRQREAGRRPALYVRNDWEHGTGASQFTPSAEDRHRPSAPAGSNNSDLHTFLTRHVRLEGARMDRIAEAAAAQMNEASNANTSRFHHAIEVLRDGGLSRRHPSSDRPSGPRSSGDASRERPPAEWYVPNRRRMRARRMRPLGDYMRDEDFDESYESLLSLAAAIGDAKPRSTPEDVISKLETGMYKDWVTLDSDKRCPICLDDYSAGDPVMKAGACSHWLHKDCLHQWLKGANTCPVCRMTVHTSPRMRHTHTRGPRQQRNQASIRPNIPATLHTDIPHNNNIRNNINVNERHDEPMITQQSGTTNAPSNNMEPPPSSPFSSRNRGINGWSGWRYYHP